MFKAKAHTGLTQDQEQQLWRFELWDFSLQTELTFIYIYHSSSFRNKHVNKDVENAIQQLTSTVHRRINILLLHVNSKA